MKAHRWGAFIRRCRWSGRALVLRPWPLLDTGREQVYYLGDARRTQVRPAGRPIDPAQVGLAVKLRQRVEERRGGRVGLERSGDVIGEVAALRAFRRQFNDQIGADCDAPSRASSPGSG